MKVEWSVSFEVVKKHKSPQEFHNYVKLSLLASGFDLTKDIDARIDEATKTMQYSQDNGVTAA